MYGRRPENPELIGCCLTTTTPPVYSFLCRLERIRDAGYNEDEGFARYMRADQPTSDQKPKKSKKGM
jgi:hypothetical protein